MLSKLLRHQVLRKALVYLFTDGINKAIPFLLLPLLTVYLSPSDYGLITNFNVLLGIALVFVGISTNGAISSNYYRLTTDDIAIYIGNALYIITSLFFLVALIVYLSNDYIYQIIKIPVEYQLLAVMLAFMQAITTINISLWRLEEKALKFGIYNIAQTAVNFGFSLYLIIILQQGWEGRVLGILIAGLIFGIISLTLLYRRGYLKLAFNPNFNKDILLFGIPLIPHALSIWIRSGIDKIFITKYIGEHDNGLYSVGLQFGLLLSFIIIAGNNAIVPFIYKNLSQKVGDELHKFKVNLVKFNMFGVIILIILGLLLSVASWFIIEYFLDTRYKDSQPFVFWAIFAQVFQGMYLLFVNYIFYLKKTKLLALITVSCSLLHIGLSYFFIKEFGAIGGAYSSTIISFINFACIAIYSQKVFPLPWNTFIKTQF